MIGVLVYFLIVLLVLGVVWWVLTEIPLPPPFLKIARVVLVVIALLFLIDILLGIGGGGLMMRRGPIW